MVCKLTWMVARSVTQAASRRGPASAPAGARVVALALALALSACATPQDRTAQAQADVDRMMTIYGPACARLGYAAQSDAWRSCVIGLSAKYDLQHYGPPPGYYGWGPGYWRGGWWGPYW